MANINLKKVGRLSVIQSNNQLTFGIGDALTAGQAARIDPTNGKAVKATSATAQGARVWGIATTETNVLGGMTLLRQGILEGYDLSSMDFDAPVYLGTDGNLSDTAGVESVKVGRVVSVFCLSSGAAKYLSVEITD